MQSRRSKQEFRERLASSVWNYMRTRPDLIEFGRFAARDRKQRGEGKPETFTFLGFSHFCGQLTTGAFIVWRITAKKRMVAKLKAIKAELQRRKHQRSTDVGVWLRKVVLGYYQYHAVPGDSTQLRIFQRRVNWLWRSVLVRRSQRAQVRWGRRTPLLARWIPQPRVLHPYPDARACTDRGVFDASLVPETCLELSPLPVCGPGIQFGKLRPLRGPSCNRARAS